MTIPSTSTGFSLGRSMETTTFVPTGIGLSARIKTPFSDSMVTYQNFRKISYATMLSENGVFIRALKTIPVGTKVVVSMDLPSEKPVEVEGLVIYTVAFNKDQFVEPGICIRFFNIDKTTQLGLRKFIE